MTELGLIEGFYGKPWTWAEREDQARFLKDAGYGFYIYAPKHDAWLRKRWREDYPQDEADALTRLSRVSAELGVSFGVGFSPFEGLPTHLGCRRARRAAHIAFESFRHSYRLLTITRIDRGLQETRPYGHLASSLVGSWQSRLPSKRSRLWLHGALHTIIQSGGTGRRFCRSATAAGAAQYPGRVGGMWR